MRKISEKVMKLPDGYVGEIEVVSDDLKNKYFVVCQTGNLFYKTFTSSYIDYLKGKTKTMPKVVEGDDYLWFNYDDSEQNEAGKTVFRQFYIDALRLVNAREKSDYLRKKYRKIQKPSCAFKYEILEKETKTAMACGPLGYYYQIRFLLRNENRELFLYSHDFEGETYFLADFNISDALENNTFDINNAIEVVYGLENICQSEYYDLYYLMERYKDGLL